MGKVAFYKSEYLSDLIKGKGQKVMKDLKDKIHKQAFSMIDALNINKKVMEIKT